MSLPELNDQVLFSFDINSKEHLLSAASYYTKG